MNYFESIELLDFLAKRFRQGGLKPTWYLWGIDKSWTKLKKWAKMLGYKGKLD